MPALQEARPVDGRGRVVKAYAHQEQELAAHAAEPARALFWEMGTGKTKAVIDLACKLFVEGKIDGVLVIAPNGVHTAWALDEVPAHRGQALTVQHAWSTGAASRKWHKQAVQALIEGEYAGLPFLCMSYDAFRTYEGRRAAEAMLHRRRCLYVLDESQRIKTPGAKRTISIVASGRRARWKRILTGTPITNRPFEVYSQMKFLDEDFWKQRGFASYEAFKGHFAILRDREMSNGGRFQEVVAYRHLDQLQAILGEVSSIVLKEDAVDLPPKVYARRYFDLPPAQREAYKQLEREFMTWLESGEQVTAALAVTRLLRLQQITCGYLPGDEGATQEFEDQPRLAALLEEIADLEGSAIVFARFQRDVTKIVEALRREHGAGAVVRYDGQVEGDDARTAARQRFQAGEARFFVGNPAVAGTGLTLTAAQHVIYYSNSFDLEHRVQSEDRAHRIGQRFTVRIVDLVARGTVDGRIVSALRRKASLAAECTGIKFFRTGDCSDV